VIGIVYDVRRDVHGACSGRRDQGRSDSRAQTNRAR